MKTSRKTDLATGAILAVLAIGSPAHAADLKLGVLNCDVGDGWGFIVGSSKDLNCSFSPSRGGVEHYVGTVSKFGVDVGYTRGGVIIWDVVAPMTGLKRGALEGSYAGATVSASVGVGAGANALIGGLRRSISLQPVSIAGETGLNVAAGVAAIHLKHVS